MAMNLRLTDENEANVRAQAEREGRNMNAVINDAIAEYVARWQQRDVMRTETAFAISQHRDLLDKLG
ncbi:hypothetical protein [Nocardia sp. NPDC004604]|uniref:hypothetical protein n=1 Tax=Nocardia sp. NPDC004604 TaxID=3157013 RepID=UPI0033B177CA